MNVNLYHEIRSLEYPIDCGSKSVKRNKKLDELTPFELEKSKGNWKQASLKEQDIKHQEARTKPSLQIEML